MKYNNFTKRVALLLGAAAIALSSQAVTLKQKNAFAFDIRVDATDQIHPVVSYKLNGLASNVGIEVYCYDTLVKTVPGTTDAENAVTLDLSTVPNGTITINVKTTTATTVTAPTQIDWAEGYQQMHYKFWAPWGLAVNNCTDSETFGQLVVCETRYYESQTTSANYISSSVNDGQGPMLYPYNGWFEPIKNGDKYGFNPGMTINVKRYKEYDSSYSGNEYVATFADVAFSEDGRLFIATGDPYISDVNGGVFEANPYSLTTPATPLFPEASKNYSTTKAGAVQALDVVGKGDALKLAIISSKSGLLVSSYYTGYIYNLGTATSWTNAPSATLGQNSMGSISEQFRQCLAFDADGNGITASRYNRWGANYRYNNANTGAYISNMAVAGNAQCQGISRNFDGTLMARQTAAGTITVYKCESANAKENLTELYSFDTGVGNFVNDISFDYADNLYCCSNNGEILKAFQLPPLEGTEKEVTVPAPASQTYELTTAAVTDFYVATNWGEDNNWNPEAAHKMDVDKGIYSITLPEGVNQFKLSTKQGNWDAFNSEVYIVEGNMVVGDHRGEKVYGLHKGSYNDGATDNIVLAEAPEAWTVYVDYNNMKIWAEQPLTLYVRGSMTNNWAAHPDWALTAGENDVFTLSGVNIDADHEWKIAEGPMTWNKYNNYDGEQDGYTGWERHNYGGHPNLKANRTKAVEFNSYNCSLDRNVTNATITYDHANKTIKVDHTAETAHAGHAYDFNYTINSEGTEATISFKSTAAGKGRVILTPTSFEDEFAGDAEEGMARAMAASYVRDNVEFTEGENSLTFNVDDLDAQNVYRVSVEYDHDTNYTFEVVGSYNGKSSSTRGGIAVIKDTGSPLYGYMISSNGNAQGLWLHSPDFEKTEKYSIGAPFSNDNVSSFRMCYYGGKAYISDHSSATGGIYTWDPANPEEPATIIYDGATYTAPWWKDADGNIIGARASTVKVVEDTNGNPQVWALLADPANWNGYKVACSGLDENGKISAAPLYTYNLGRMSNQNVELWPSKLHNGWWAVQERANGGNSAGIPSFEFVTVDGATATCQMTSGSIENIDGSRNAIAVNEDESLLFYSSRDGDIVVCDIEWNGDKPTVTYALTIPGTRNAEGYYQFDFDPAGNLVAWGAGSQIKVIAVEQKAKTTTMTAPKNVGFMVDNEGTMTSVEDMVAEQEAEAVYYNLNGQRISAERLTPGIYVRVNGSKTQKVVIR